MGEEETAWNHTLPTSKSYFYPPGKTPDIFLLNFVKVSTSPISTTEPYPQADTWREPATQATEQSRTKLNESTLAWFLFVKRT